MLYDAAGARLVQPEDRLMRTAIASYAILLAVVAVASARDDDAKKAQESLQGKWKLVAGEMGGMKMPEGALENGSWVIKDNHYTFRAAEQTEKGTIKLDPGKKPAAIDLEITEGGDKGKTQVGIYKLEGDKLTVCVARAGDKERPTEFKTKEGTEQLMFTFQRDKP
jgi:uncharacterized protein (TIGR03067 family)